MHMTELDSAVWCTPRSLTHPHCDTNRRVWVSNVMHLTKLDSAVWCTLYTMKPDSSTLWYELPSVSQLCDAHDGDRLCCMMYIVHQGAWLIHSVMQTGNRVVWVSNVMHITKLDSAVWCTPRSLTHPHCNMNRRVWVSNVMHITKLDSAVWFTPRSLTHPQCDKNRRAWVSNVMHITKFDSAVRCTLRSLTHPQCYTNRRVWVGSMMHTVTDSAVLYDVH